jgi:hypothetical protein
MNKKTVQDIFKSIAKKKSSAINKYKYKIQKFHCTREEYDLFQSYCNETGTKKSKLFRDLVNDFIRIHTSLGGN